MRTLLVIRGVGSVAVALLNGTGAMRNLEDKSVHLECMAGQIVVANDIAQRRVAVIDN